MLTNQTTIMIYGIILRRINHFLIFIFTVMVLSSCEEKKISVVLDNPTREEIKVSFENDFFAYIKPYAQRKLSFTAGEHQVYLDDKLVGTFNIEQDDEYVLNPTQSDYYIEEVGFGVTGMLGKRNLESNNKELKEINEKSPFQLTSVMVDSMNYAGFVIKTNDIAIKRIWQFGIKEKLDDEIQVSQYVTNDSRTKIFRKSAFVKFHKLYN